MSSGKWAFRPRLQVVESNRTGGVKWATWPKAWTPASVRPAPVIRTGFTR
ncbi:MAG: hypothetical protein MPW15_04180 [Candidatus Manganitrophus sp.]|nr:hypothetical protein [Candidatus Manganitrophus sp.]